MSFLSSYLTIVEGWSKERQLSGSWYSQLFEMTIRPDAIPASAKQTVTWPGVSLGRVVNHRATDQLTVTAAWRRWPATSNWFRKAAKNQTLLPGLEANPTSNGWSQQRGENLIWAPRADYVTSVGGVYFPAQNRKWWAKMSMFGLKCSSCGLWPGLISVMSLIKAVIVRSSSQGDLCFHCSHINSPVSPWSHFIIGR